VVRIPPLRERDGDALLLARTFLDVACRRYGAPSRRLGPSAEAAVRSHGWPGNVRELANTMERLVLMSDADPVEATDLGLEPGSAGTGRIGVAPTGEVQVDIPEAGLSLEAVERALLVTALARCGGNQSAAARLLGVSRDTMRYRMEKFGLGE
jgi:DNA-binding NtrC family response regulator